MNEGGLFAERQGFHLPKPPTRNQFVQDSPLDSSAKAGIRYFTAPLILDLPSDKYEIPLSFVFGGITGGAARIQLYVNGWQFGKYISHIGPQTRFPVPEGILNYRGENWIGLMIWTMEDKETRLTYFRLESGTPVLSGRSIVKLVDSPAYKERTGAY